MSLYTAFKFFVMSIDMTHDNMKRSKFSFILIARQNKVDSQCLFIPIVVEFHSQV